MIKVLHLANVGGESRGGGIHEVAYNFYQYQSKLGINPELWFPGNDIERQHYAADKNIKVLTTIGHPNFAITTQLITAKYSLDFDIIHQHGIWLPTSLISMKFRKSNTGLTILQPHGLLEPFGLGVSKYKKKVAYKLYEKENITNSNILLACSYKEAYNLKKMFPQKNVGVIANGVPVDFILKKSSNDYHDDFPGKMKMLYLSQIYPLKGLERFLKAIHEIGKEKFKHWVIIIAGIDVGGHEKDLKKLATELGLDSLVQFVGPKFGQDKIDIMTNADLFILPTFSENYGIVVAEALSRGVPVLTTKGAPWSELDKHDCGFWVENNEQGVKDGLMEVLDIDETRLKEMGAKGKELILSKYTWEKTTLNTKILYEWLLGGGAKPEFIISN